MPLDGSFTEAVRAANARPDKQRRYRIFILAGHHLSPGDGTPLRVKDGERELTVPSPMTVLTAPNTSICGEGSGLSVIESRPRYEGISVTATLMLHGADSTFLQDFTLWSHYRDAPGAFAVRSVALREQRCRGNILRNVSLLSNQDTYVTNSGGTTFLSDCDIHGTVDFICGGGTVFFDRCRLHLRPRGRRGNVICAPATEDSLSAGYVFSRCTILGDALQAGRYKLGRPWQKAPQAVFLHTRMMLPPDASGWAEMHGTLPRLFAEYASVDSLLRPVAAAGRRTRYRNREGVPVEVMHAPVLTADEAAAYDLRRVFPSWHPDEAGAPVAPPEVCVADGALVWDDVPGAGLYAVCLNGRVAAFTTHPRYRIPSDSPSGARYGVRCANFYGALGPLSREVMPSPAAPPAAGTPCTFDPSCSYLRWVVNSRLGDFKANTQPSGFALFDAGGRMLAPSSRVKSTLDYVPGLVAKALLEAVDCLRSGDARAVAPWYYAVADYALTCSLSAAGLRGESFDDLNAVKLYCPLLRLAREGCFADSPLCQSDSVAAVAQRRFSETLAAFRLADSLYAIKATVRPDAAGGWWHKKRYINQMWCDGQYMGPALLAQLINEDPHYRSLSSDDWALIARQFTVSWRHLWDPRERLLYHAFAADPADSFAVCWQGVSAEPGAEVLHSAEFWGRAEAWYFMALVDVLEQMRLAGRSGLEDFRTLHGFLEQLAAGIAARQDRASGCWYQLLARDSTFVARDYRSDDRWTDVPVRNYLESSCTAIFTAAYLKAMRLGLLGREYMAVASRAYRGFVERFMVHDGRGGVHLLGSCRSAGLSGGKQRDGSAAYYLLGRDTRPTGPDSADFFTEGKVLGGFIMAATEWERRGLTSLFSSCADDKGTAVAVPAAKDCFTLWNHCEALTALQEYVEDVTNPDSENFVREEDRIAVFDMDGTFVGELYPSYFEYNMLEYRALDDASYAAPGDVAETAQEIRDYVRNGKPLPDHFDMKHARAAAKAYAGMTPAEFDAYVKAYAGRPANGFTGMTYGESFFKPMLQVFDYLEDKGFTCYVVSGSDRFICRALVERLGIGPNRVIGMDVKLRSTGQGAEEGVNHTFGRGESLVRTDELIIKNLKPNKVLQIAQEIGKVPVLSFGNSSGDVAMHNYTLSNPDHRSAAFMLIADDDRRDHANREKALKLGEQWRRAGYHVISMRDDFRTIYGDGVQKTDFTFFK